MLDLKHFPPLIDPMGAVRRDARLIPDTNKMNINGGYRRVISPWAALHADPTRKSGTLTTLLYGEALLLLGEDGDWGYGQSLIDGYVGWILLSSIAEDKGVNGKVTALLTNIYDFPDIKSMPRLPLPFGALVEANFDHKHNGFVEIKNMGWVPEGQISGLPHADGDLIASAMMFLECPYLWGGRTMCGLDCSALVQLSLMSIGLRVHRDSDLQYESLGVEVEPNQIEKGDLVFFPGHVGIAIEGEHILHANATHMKVTIDPLNEILQWVQADLDKKKSDVAALKGVKRLL